MVLLKAEDAEVMMWILYEIPRQYVQIQDNVSSTYK